MSQSQTTVPERTAKTEGSATQRAYLELRKMIVTGQLPPDKRLKIDQLKEALGLGASPIREALSLLTSDQLVDRVDQKGFRTAVATRENFQEILGLRCLLEEKALRSSIGARPLAWEETLVLTLHRLNRVNRQSQEDIERFEVLHKDFHIALLSACGSPVLLRLCSQLYDLNIRYRYLAGQTLSYGKRNVGDEHAAIMEAAIDGDADLATERLLKHYRDTGGYLAELFD